MQPGMYIWLVSAHHVEGRHILLIHSPWDGPLSYLQLPTTLELFHFLLTFPPVMHPLVLWATLMRQPATPWEGQRSDARRCDWAGRIQPQKSIPGLPG